MSTEEIMRIVDQQMKAAQNKKQGPRRTGTDRRVQDVPVAVERRQGERRSSDDRRAKARTE